MKVLIIEDEKPAAEKLELLLKKYDPSIKVIDKIQSVENSVAYLKENEEFLDLIFMDIQLTDGISFDIFKNFSVTKPIIFITAYNDYAIEAFQVNSIDYLLKPITFDGLSKSLKKIESLRENLPGETNLPTGINDIAKLLSNIQKNYKSRFMVKIGEHIKSVASNDINVFYADGRTVFIQTKENKKYIVDYKMEELVDLLDPQVFFRINRSVIVNFEAITDVVVYSNSRLKIRMPFEIDKEIIVSREKVNEFKQWFSGS
jgi:two-component system, LytTR family, response regulator